MNFLRDTPVLVLGLGDSGLAMARWCAHCGARVTVWDSRDQPPHAAMLATEVPGVALLRGEALPALLEGQQMLLKSPGLAPADPRVAPLLQAARERGLACWGELDLFARALQDLKTDQGYAPQLLAVTGTNGKTTTAAMTALLVERAGRRVGLAGNIGPTMLDTLMAALDTPTDTWPQVWVLELSSFQLEGGGAGVNAASGYMPDAAVVLNVTPDHLDWHGSLDHYAAAKARVFGVAAAQGVMVLNRDDALVEAMQPRAPEGKLKPKDRVPERAVLRFGLDAPRRPGDFGLVTEGGMAWLVRALPADETLKTRKGGRQGEEDEIHLQRLMPADALRVRGRHNASNALAALALATAVGCPLAPILHGLREYAGEPHRVQGVGRVGEVDAYDDSKGTNVGATVAAVQGLGADLSPARLVLILGGDGKGQDFSALAAPLQRHARAVATLGRDAPAVEAAVAEALQVAGVPLQRFDSLPAATAWCFEQARAGDAVLLSPACASLDMFSSYVHRAQVFVDAVRALAADRGEVLA